MDRRAGFFLGAAALAFAMVPIADSGHRWVALLTGTVYLVLAALSALDRHSRDQIVDRRPRPQADLFGDEETMAPMARVEHHDDVGTTTASDEPGSPGDDR